MSRSFLNPGASAMLVKWHDAIMERFSKHPFQQRSHNSTQTVLPSETLTPEMLMDFDEMQFQRLVAGFFRAVGFVVVTEAPSAAGDASAMESPRRVTGTLLFRRGEALPFGLVHWKWHILEVGARAVAELQGAMTNNQLAEGYLVTTGTFTSEARTSRNSRALTLLDGTEFLAHFNRLPKIVRAAALAEISEHTPAPFAAA